MAPRKEVKTKSKATLKQTRPKKMFTRDEEHAILVRVVDKFLLFGFVFVGIAWYWLVTHVLYLTRLQEALMFASFGILAMLMIFSLIMRDYEFNRRAHERRK